MDPHYLSEYHNLSEQVELHYLSVHGFKRLRGKTYSSCPEWVFLFYTKFSSKILQQASSEKLFLPSLDARNQVQALNLLSLESWSRNSDMQSFSSFSIIHAMTSNRHNDAAGLNAHIVERGQDSHLLKFIVSRSALLGIQEEAKSLEQLRAQKEVQACKECNNFHNVRATLTTLGI